MNVSRPSGHSAHIVRLLLFIGIRVPCEARQKKYQYLHSVGTSLLMDQHLCIKDRKAQENMVLEFAPSV